MRSGDLPCRSAGGQRGFGYLLVLFALASMGLLLAGAGEVWHTTAQREKEADLLFIGHQFRQALVSYHAQSPEAARQYPSRLEDLLEDGRFPVARRHLRKLYRDPMTGSTEWGLVRAAGRIVGVHSLSEGTPLKAAFDERDAALAGASRYDQWVFMHDGSKKVP